MNQLIAHLIGDYWLQTSWMAFNKEKSWLATLAHDRDGMMVEFTCPVCETKGWGYP